MSPAVTDPCDALIIGAGPTGLFAAFYAGLRQMSVGIVDSLDEVGGQLTALYPEKYIYDVAGYPRVLAKELVTHLREQAQQYQPQLHLGERVLSLEMLPEAGGYLIRTDRAERVARAIIISAGIGAFTPKTLPLPEVACYEGHGLHYFAKRLEDFRNKRVLIIGGGDSAVDWANTLASITAHQTLIHRRDVFRAHEDSVQRMKQGPTKILLFHELKSINGDTTVASATVYDTRSRHEQTLDVDAILVNIGFESSLGPIKDWGLELEGGQIKVDSMMQTSRPGIFAAGDIATYPGKLKLIATGFGEAAIAVNFAKHYLDPKANIFPGHSTNLKR